MADPTVLPVVTTERGSPTQRPVELPPNVTDINAFRYRRERRAVERREMTSLLPEVDWSGGK